jgi:carbamoyltransferase
MNILGISAGFHDAAVSVVSPYGEILFAAHSERYSKIKNDSGLSHDLLQAAAEFDIDDIAYYERPWRHNLQRLHSGQRPLGPWTLTGTLMKELGPWYDRIPALRYRSYPHHLSHAAAGFQTSPFESAAVVVIDAIGELETISIYRASYDENSRAQYQLMWQQRYPHSIGLFYSAVTEHIGLRPMDEEYITMGMSAYGTPVAADRITDRLIADPVDIRFRENLHTGLNRSEWHTVPNEVMAASAQQITERMITNVMARARSLTGESRLVYMGGVALNCLANRNLGEYFNDIWIMPNPGDAGSSLGAAALSHGGHINWRDAFLGHRILGDYPVRDALHHLLARGIVGVASGCAEFGPRALGNRSLLADPRGQDTKDRVNEIKRRQKFRPFAPVILAEMVNDHFDMPRGWRDSDYMQVVARCRHPDLYPAVCHVDGTSRVQTVPKDSTSGIRQLLESWYQATGCPMLLNTSLNIRGEPMVNDRADADRFESEYGVTVCS